MDYRIQKPQLRCATTDRPLTAGDAFYSALIREDGKIVRRDVAADAWEGQPEASLAWWRSVVPAEDAKPTLAPVDVLLDLLEQLEDDLSDAPLRYLLALVLVRRRVLKIVDGSDETISSANEGCEPTRFTAKKRGDRGHWRPRHGHGRRVCCWPHW